MEDSKINSVTTKIGKQKNLLKTLLRKICSLEFQVFILTIQAPQPLNILILKNLGSMSNEICSHVMLGSKCEMGYLKLFKKDKKKAFKGHQKEELYLIFFKLKTPILM